MLHMKLILLYQTRVHWRKDFRLLFFLNQGELYLILPDVFKMCFSVTAFAHVQNQEVKTASVMGHWMDCQILKDIHVLVLYCYILGFLRFSKYFSETVVITVLHECCGTWWPSLYYSFRLFKKISTESTSYLLQWTFKCI